MEIKSRRSPCRISKFGEFIIFCKFFKFPVADFLTSPNTLNFLFIKYLQIVDPSCPVAPKTKIFFLLIFFQ